MGGNSAYVLGSNEPDFAFGRSANPIVRRKYLQYWHAVETQYPNRKLVSPAPSHEGSGVDGKPDFLQEFYEDYKALYRTAPRFDSLAVHCYASPNQASVDFCKRVVQKALDKVAAWGLPGGVWLTEFGVVSGCAFSCQSTNVACNIPSVNYCETSAYQSEPGLCFNNQLVTSSCAAGDANCGCSDWEAGRSLCKQSYNGGKYLVSSCGNFPVAGIAASCTCETLSKATRVCIQQTGVCNIKTSCSQTCDWNASQGYSKQFIDWLTQQPRLKRHAAYTTRVKGVEYFWNHLDTTTRLFSCNTGNELDVSCTNATLTPLGNLYKSYPPRAP